MENLAGREDCDVPIERELMRAGIEIMRGERTNSEVPASISGKLGNFTFHRAWYYWVVDGRVPLAVAEKLYADPVGKDDVRVAGHCGCPPPNEWVTYIDEEGRRLASMSQKPEEGSSLAELFEGKTDIRFVEDPSSAGQGFITTYHIDTEVGLRLFVDTLKTT